MEGVSLFLASALVAGTPLLFATLGEIITERAGNMNLGVEGMMLMGAVTGFYVGFMTKNPILSILAGACGGAAGALIFAFLTVSLRANQVVCGLTLSIFGTGFSSFMGKDLTGKAVPDELKACFQKFKIPYLGDIPYLGRILFDQDVYVYFGFITAILLGVYLYKTRPGLSLRAIGENPGSADSTGINITFYKYIHILLGGALCGLGGAYLSLVYVPSWQEGITAGRGWIAVALVIFSSWNPYKAILGSYLFGGLDIIGFRFQGTKIAVSQYLIDMLPYIVTIVILVFTSFRKSKGTSGPRALGNPYYREER